MIRKLIQIAAILTIIAALTGCKELPLPPEAEQASIQETGLWRTGAETYAANEYRTYMREFTAAKKHLAEESSKFRLFRNYEAVQLEFRNVMSRGEIVQNVVRDRKSRISNEMSKNIVFYQKKIDSLRKLSSLINEGWLASRSLIKAEVLLKETESYMNTEKYLEAGKKLAKVSELTSIATKAIYPIFDRYTDRDQITKWKKWVKDTVELSRKQGNYSIIVSKLDRELLLYRAGRLQRTYEINIGSNGSRDKLYAGDMATPEGKYRIIKKRSDSKYYKALLINYPNEEDRKTFVKARKQGLVPRNAGIGGLIEVHGGSKQGMTYGCIALDNKHMDELFRVVDAGTPITIVGAIEYENSISNAINEL